MGLGRQHNLDTKYYTSLRIKDTLFAWTIKLLVCIAIIPLFAILWFLFSKGISSLSFSFFVETAPIPIPETTFLNMTEKERLLAIGGILNSFIGMLCIVSIASLISIPLAIIISVYTVETQYKWLKEAILLCIDVMQGIPSIILGIIINLWIVETFSAYSGLAGSLALALMMLPTVIKSTIESLQLVPSSLRYASLALGASYSSTILRILLPTALGGIAVGILLSISRIMGETAPLLFTAFGNPYITYNMLQPMETISMQIYKNALSPNTNLIENAWTAALILVLLILCIHIFIKPLVEKWKIQF